MRGTLRRGGGAADGRLDLQIGVPTEISVDLSTIDAVEVSDPGVLRCHVTDGSVRFVALEKGIATVTLSGEDETLFYVVRTWNITPSDITDMLSDVPGIEMKVAGDKVRLSGGLLARTDSQQVQKLAETYPTTSSTLLSTTTSRPSTRL